jgi:hypothetical protein
MFGLIFNKYFKPGTRHIFVFSFLVFIVLNIIENVIHYNIGKFHEANSTPIKGNGNGNGNDRSIAGFHFTNPSDTDWVRIVVIMFIFAVLQGIFTSYFSVC